MLQSGASRELLERWCTEQRNSVIIAGYAVEGTLAKEIMNEPEAVTTLDKRTIPRRMNVATISFAAHVDYQQNRDFIRALAPKYVILVHGESTEMARFKRAFEQEYEADPEYNFTMYNPANVDVVEFNFRGDKMAKVIGTVAEEPAREGKRLSGVLFKRKHNYFIVVCVIICRIFANQ